MLSNTRERSTRPATNRSIVSALVGVIVFGECITILALRGRSVEQLWFFAVTFAIVSLTIAMAILAFYGSITKAAFGIIAITVVLILGANLFIIHTITHLG